MKWLLRFLWLLAWSVWLWLGVRLVFELPRTIGASLAHIPLVVGETVLGFLPDSNELATVRPSMVRVYNPNTGAVEREAEGDWLPQDPDFALLRHGVIYGAPPVNKTGPDPRGGGFLDLRTGRWTNIDFYIGVGPIYHSWRPIALFFPALRNGDEVVVVDVRTGKRLSGWRSKDWHGEDLFCAFFVGDDRLAVCIRRRKAPRPDFADEDYRVELYPLDADAPPLAVFDGMHVGEDRSSSSTGRVAWNWRGEKPRPIDVFDFNDRRYLLAVPPPAARNPRSDYSAPDRGGPTLTEDGAILLHGTNQELWDVDRAKPLWQAAPHESLHRGPGTPYLGRFSVAENWHIDLGRWSTSYSTTAIRDLRTGAVLYRIRESLSRPDLFSFDGRYYFDGEYTYAMPPPPNYTLVAGAQAILALPLVLLWLLLRWRRKRLRILEAAL